MKRIGFEGREVDELMERIVESACALEAAGKILKHYRRMPLPTELGDEDL